VGGLCRLGSQISDVLEATVFEADADKFVLDLSLMIIFENNIPGTSTRTVRNVLR